MRCARLAMKEEMSFLSGDSWFFALMLPAGLTSLVLLPVAVWVPLCLAHGSFFLSSHPRLLSMERLGRKIPERRAESLLSRFGLFRETQLGFEVQRSVLRSGLGLSELRASDE